MLILIRGIPGSGKSTFAKRFQNVKHLEADMYWSSDHPFNPSELSGAHRWCQDLASHYLAEGLDVVVSNTFTRIWEMRPYLEMDNDVVVFRMVNDYANIHGVPRETVEKMRNRFEDYASEIKVA